MNEKQAPHRREPLDAFEKDCKRTLLDPNRRRTHFLRERIAGRLKIA